jgi:hypothetical protein
MKRFLFALAGLALVVGPGSFAAPTVDTDPNQKYEITPAAGQWMICAASYSGEQAANLSHELVLDIRRNYNLPAYIFNRSAEERRQQQAEIERIRQNSPEGARIRIHRIEDQFAVLVGGYKDMESARKALDGFKKLKPTNKKVMDTITRQHEAVQDGKKGIMTETILVNPFVSSFVVRNPTVPAEQVQKDQGPDPFLKEINRGESYSVYKCKKQWTLAVAVFQTPGVVQNEASSSFLDKIWGNGASDRLTASAMNAHNLAEALEKLGRQWGINEVYVFHTRYNSVVTIGGFERKDDPQMAIVQMALQKHLRPDVQVKLLAQPLPMEVPH